MSVLMNGLNISLVLKYLCPNSDNSALKCWWNDVDIDCNGIFYNNFDVTGNCFTFNFGEHILYDKQIDQSK